jgi:hypothetical protein
MANDSNSFKVRKFHYLACRKVVGEGDEVIVAFGNIPVWFVIFDMLKSGGGHV